MKQTTTHLLSVCILAFVAKSTAFAQTPDTAACAAAARNEMSLGKSAATAAKPDLAAALERFDRARTMLESCGLGQTFDMFSVEKNTAEALDDSQRFAEALQYSTAAYELYPKVAPPNQAGIHKFYSMQATLLMRHSREAEALPIWEQTLQTNPRRHKQDSLDFANCLHSQSICFTVTRDPEAALPVIERAIALRTRILGPTHPHTLSSKNNLAGIYDALGEYQKGLDLKISLLPYLPKKGGFTIAQCYRNIASGYFEINDIPQSIAAYEIALRMGRGNEERPMVMAGIIENLAHCLTRTGQNARALELLQELLALLEKNLPAGHPRIARAHNGIGCVHRMANRFEDSHREMAIAMAIFEKSGTVEDFYYYKDIRLDYARSLRLVGRPDSARTVLRHLLTDQQAIAKKPQNIADTWAELARCDIETGRFEAALTLLDSALAAENCDKPVGHFQIWNKCSEFHELKTRALAQRAKRGTTSGPLLEKAVESARRSIGALQNERFQLEADESRVFRGDESHNAFETAISTALAAARQIDHRDDLAATAFDFSEQAKARTLLETLQNARALHDARLPDSLLQRERLLRLNLAFAEKQCQALENTEGPEALALNKKRFDAQQAQGRFLAKLERDFPTYFRMKYDISTVSVAEIQRQMPDEKTALLSYFVGDSAIFVFLVRKNALDHLEIPRDFPLEEWVADFRKGISGYHTARKKTAVGYRQTCDQYARAAQDLYQKLLAPLAAKLPDTLVVLPDGLLNYLPFEALLTSAPPTGIGADNFQNWPFLLKAKTLRYGNSATLLQQLRTQKSAAPAPEGLLAFAPFSERSADSSLLSLRYEALAALSDAEFDSLRFGLSPLPFSKKEAKTAVDLFGGEALYGQAATVAAFQKTAPKYRILLLATHAKADYDGSFLLFANKNGGVDSVFARDIHALDLRADLVVLSACQTGIGRLRRGEGLMSLARAFTYAGAKNILTTLWRVEDAPQASLSVGFFQHLKEGLPKTAALRLAKLEYLKNAPGQGGHPFFWAGMVLLGE